MTYQFSEELGVLQTWLAGHGVDLRRIVSERQAAFRAQNLAGTRIKFPPRGYPCFSVLAQIQQHIIDASSARQTKPRPAKNARPNHRPGETRAAAVSYAGLVVFTDGACVPNPGPGGWAWVAYRDGVEIFSERGGDPDTTNNRMELEAIAHAVTWLAQTQVEVSGVRAGVGNVVIYTDSDYALGVSTGTYKAKKNKDVLGRIRELLRHCPEIRLEWTRGHVGERGNERADQLAEMGRMAVVAGAAA